MVRFSGRGNRRIEHSRRKHVQHGQDRMFNWNYRSIQSNQQSRDPRILSVSTWSTRMGYIGRICICTATFLQYDESRIAPPGSTNAMFDIIWG